MRPTSPGQSVYWLHSRVRTTNPHQRCPGPPHRDDVYPGIPFLGILSLTRFRPGVPVLIDRNECRAELRSWHFRYEHAKSPSAADPETGSSEPPPRRLQSGTALPPAPTNRREKKPANHLSVNGISRALPRASTSPPPATDILFSDLHSSHRKLKNVL